MLISRSRQPKDQPFLMPIEDVFSISGRGTVVTGRVERGVIKVGEEVEIVGLRATTKTVCTGVEMFRKLLDQGEAGDNIGVLLRGTKREDVERGQDAGEAGDDHAPHTTVSAEAYILTKEEGVAHAVLHQLPAAVLLPDDRRDRHGAAAGGHRDGDAGRQHLDGSAADPADRHGRGAALRHPRGRRNRRRRRRRQDHRIARDAAQAVGDEGYSSAGRAAVSKPPGRGFRSCCPCQVV